MISKDGQTWEHVINVPEQAGSPTTVNFDGVYGRYVRVQLHDINYLSMAEVEVMGTILQDILPLLEQWEELSGGVGGADIVSDGEHLYRIGGLDHCTSIYQYNGPQQNTWTLLTDSNPQCWSHRSPGENNRSWYYAGKIIVLGQTVTIYDLANDVWTIHDLPVFDHLSWIQGGVLNAVTGEAYIVWTEADTKHSYATAALNVASGTWGPTYDRNSRIDQGNLTLEDTSGYYVFDLIRGDQFVQLRIYDLLSQPHDFSGTWTLSSIHDMGADRFFMYPDRNYGSDNMAWDPVNSKLYLVATEHGMTLKYDPIEDSWQELVQRPTGYGYRDGHTAIADGRLYNQNLNYLWYMGISQSPYIRHNLRIL